MRKAAPKYTAQKKQCRRLRKKKGQTRRCFQKCLFRKKQGRQARRRARSKQAIRLSDSWRKPVPFPRKQGFPFPQRKPSLNLFRAVRKFFQLWKSFLPKNKPCGQAPDSQKFLWENILNHR